jgi:hypothetical protein
MISINPVEIAPDRKRCKLFTLVDRKVERSLNAEKGDKRLDAVPNEQKRCLMLALFATLVKSI